MTPTELQKLRKQQAEIDSKVYRAERLLDNLNQLKDLKNKITKGDNIQLQIDDDYFDLYYIGLKSDDIKKMFIDIIDNKYNEFNKEWEGLE
jgi:hypothetical protein